MRSLSLLALALVAPTITARQTADVDSGLALVRDALEQQQVVDLWTDVVPTTELAKAQLARAGVTGDDTARALAGYVTADAIGAWHQVLMDANLGGTDVTTAAEQSRGTSIDEIVESLAAVEGELAITSRVLVNILFEVQDYDRASTSLGKALEIFPASEDVHAVARQWHQFHPQPRTVVAALDAAFSDLGADRAIDAETASRLMTTQGHFLHAEGLQTYNNNDLSAAARSFEQAARHFRTADAMHRGADSLQVAQQVAQSWVYAGWSHYYQAVNTVGEEAAALDDASRTRGGSQQREFSAGNEVVIGHLDHSESSFLEALRSLPGDSNAVLGLTYVGSFYKDNLGDDMCRDFFARIAPRASEAAWWNNLGFLSRDTGVAAEFRGDTERARELYEQAYHAYSQCIALAPDNARWVNDTGLMLYYHLNRNLEAAEQHFRRSWELGREVCDNPFVDEAKHDENFLAYTDAMLNLARLCSDQDRLDEAKAVIDELVELAPMRPDARLTQREIEAKLGVSAEAEASASVEG